MHDGSHVDDPSPPQVDTRLLKRIGIIIGIIAAVAVIWGILSRRHSDHDLAKWTQDQSIPTVAVIQPKPTGAGDALVLPGNVQAFNSAPVYARTSGYVSKWFVDIGAPVTAGQLLALIDAPEVEQQLVAARADLQTAKANENLSSTTATRWQALLKQDAVSKQETDERNGDLAAKKAVTNASAANVARLEALNGFNRIIAPFTGIVTSRATQIGQLVTAGSASAQPLFTVSDVSRIRTYVRVPQAFSAQVKVGDHVVLSLPEYPSRKFDAVMTRTAGAVDQQSGTVLVELQSPNSDGALKPGAYAQVTFPISGASGSVSVPASAILYRSDGTIVATVDPNGHAKLNRITIGRDSGDTLEVTAGLAVNDRVIDSPPDSIENGDPVQIAKPAPQAASGGANADAAH